MFTQGEISVVEIWANGRRVEYDMSDILRSCVEKHTAKICITTFDRVSTPFLTEQDSAPSFEEEPSWDQLLGRADWSGKQPTLKQIQQGFEMEDEPVMG